MFQIDSIENAEKFDVMFKKYFESKHRHANQRLSLARLYELSLRLNAGRRLFVAFLDFYIVHSFFTIDIHCFCGISNDYFSKGKEEGGTIFDNDFRFIGKMNLYYYASSLVLRGRALWDKIMGILIMMHHPEKYQDFCKASSRKIFFKKTFSAESYIKNPFIESIVNIVSEFDEKLRTAEAHHSGILRKYCLSMDHPMSTPMKLLLEHSNAINHVISYFEKISIQYTEKKRHRRAFFRTILLLQAFFPSLHLCLRGSEDFEL